MINKNHSSLPFPAVPDLFYCSICAKKSKTKNIPGECVVTPQTKIYLSRINRKKTFPEQYFSYGMIHHIPHYFGKKRKY